MALFRKEIFRFNFKAFFYLLILGGGLLPSSLLLARQDLVPGSRYTSGRGAAMGDAYFPFIDDGAAALFYNPAAFGKVKYMQLEPLNFQMQSNTDYLNIVDRNFYKVFSLSNYASTLMRKTDKFPGVSGAIFPNFGARGFGFGILMQDEISATSDGSNIRYRSKYLFIPAFGAGVRLAGGVVRMGYSLQWVNQASGDLVVPSTTDPLGYDQGLAKGSAVSHTAGFALTLPIAYLPSINLVARNILGAHFGSFTILSLAKNTSGTPANEPMSFDASFGVQPKMGKGGSLNFALALRDVTSRSPMSLFGRLSSGVEFDFRDQFFLRGGWRSGYFSAGIGLRRKTAEFAMSWYTEEIGTSYRELGDTRYLLHYQIRAF